jgi:hypothetical protein
VSITAAVPYALRNLSQVIDDNLGGIDAAWYCDVADVVYCPDPATARITENVVLRPGACWYQLLATRGTLRYTQPGKEDRQGTIWQAKLVAALARQTAGLAGGLEAVDGRRLLLLYRDHNGLVQLVGTPDCPLTWLDKYDSGDNSTRNGYDVTISGELTRRARPYGGTWLVSGVGLESGVTQQQGAGGTVRVVDRRGNVLAVVPAGQSMVVRSAFKVSFVIQ